MAQTINDLSTDMPKADLAPVTLAVFGVGQRGKKYASYGLTYPFACKVVAFAEPRVKTREDFAQTHKIPANMTFTSHEELLSASAKLLKETGKRIADAVIIAVQDQMHAEVTLKCVEQGFDILCEKPMATTPEDCIRMADAVAKSGCIFGMCHVLRYSPYNHELMKHAHSGELGQLINATHLEPVGNWHFAHSFVRGNWGNEAKSSFSLLTKSCHDLDIISQYLSPATAVQVSSFGSLTHFKRSAKPQEAGDAKRCVDCSFEPQCPYSAKRIYLGPVLRGSTGWPASVIVDGPPDIENIGEAVKNGPYGHCVYESDNDVVDHQVVNIQFSTGATCSFTMVAFTTLICERQTRLHFSHGEIVGDSSHITITNFKHPPEHPQRTVQLTPPVEDTEGHGGGDFGLMRQFLKAVQERDQKQLGTDVQEVLKSHLLVFAAERSRRTNTVVDVAAFEAQIRAEMNKPGAA